MKRSVETNIVRAKMEDVFILVIVLTVVCPPVSHTYGATADCHSHCLITPHLCLCLILLLLLLLL